MKKQMTRTVLMLMVGLFLATAAYAQAVTGRILSATGEPQPFATVQVKGTQRFAVADAHGNFSISAKQGDVLIITSNSIEAKEVTVDRRRFERNGYY
jgi:hypothetical protein